MADRTTSLRVRPALESDADALLRWRNDPEARRWSHGRDEIGRDEHRLWLRGVLGSPERLLFVAELADTADTGTTAPVGMVRFDRLDEPGEVWEVSIAVAPEYRGRRLAAPLLAEGERELRRRSAGTVRASVHRDNAVSVALFRAAGYRPDGADGEFLRLVKAGSPAGLGIE